MTDQMDQLDQTDQAEEADQPRDDEFVIEELSRRTGITVRSRRSYQSR